MLDLLEEKIIAKIETAQKFKTVAGYAGEFDRENLSGLIPSFPACYVMIETVPIVRLDNIQFGETITFSTLICTASLRSRDAARTEAFQLIRPLLNTLANQTLVMDIEPLTPRLINLVFVDKDITVWAIRWETSAIETPTTLPA